MDHQAIQGTQVILAPLDFQDAQVTQVHQVHKVSQVTPDVQVNLVSVDIVDFPDNLDIPDILEKVAIQAILVQVSVDTPDFLVYQLQLGGLHLMQQVIGVLHQVDSILYYLPII